MININHNTKIKYLILGLILLAVIAMISLSVSQKNLRNQAIKTTPTNQTDQNIDTDWKNYTSKYGFSFSYPATSQLQFKYSPSIPAGVADTDQISFVVNNINYQVIIYVNSMNNCHDKITRRPIHCNSLEDWIETAWSSPGLDRYTKLLVDGKTAYRLDVNDNTTFVSRNNVVDVNAYTQAGPTSNNSLFNRFISSFSLTR